MKSALGTRTPEVVPFQANTRVGVGAHLREVGQLAERRGQFLGSGQLRSIDDVDHPVLGKAFPGGDLHGQLGPSIDHMAISTAPVSDAGTMPIRKSSGTSSTSRSAVDGHSFSRPLPTLERCERPSGAACRFSSRQPGCLTVGPEGKLRASRAHRPALARLCHFKSHPFQMSRRPVGRAWPGAGAYTNSAGTPVNLSRIEIEWRWLHAPSTEASHGATASAGSRRLGRPRCRATAPACPRPRPRYRHRGRDRPGGIRIKGLPSLSANKGPRLQVQAAGSRIAPECRSQAPKNRSTTSPSRRRVRPGRRRRRCRGPGSPHWRSTRSAARSGFQATRTSSSLPSSATKEASGPDLDGLGAQRFGKASGTCRSVAACPPENPSPAAHPYDARRARPTGCRRSGPAPSTLTLRTGCGRRPVWRDHRGRLDGRRHPAQAEARRIGGAQQGRRSRPDCSQRPGPASNRSPARRSKGSTTQAGLPLKGSEAKASTVHWRMGRNPPHLNTIAGWRSATAASIEVRLRP